jgi:hypothetical protein
MVNDSGSVRTGGTCALALAATLLAGAVSAQNGEEQERDAPRDVRTCLSHPQIDRTKILNDSNIIFVMRDDTIYASRLPKQCPSLRRNSVVNYAVESSRVCAGSYFQVLWNKGGAGNYAPGFICRLGWFVPITAAELEDLTAMTEPDRTRRAHGRGSREAVTTEPVELPKAEPTPAPQ